MTKNLIAPSGNNLVTTTGNNLVLFTLRVTRTQRGIWSSRLGVATTGGAGVFGVLSPVERTQQGEYMAIWFHCSASQKGESLVFNNETQSQKGTSSIRAGFTDEAHGEFIVYTSYPPIKQRGVSKIYNTVKPSGTGRIRIARDDADGYMVYVGYGQMPTFDKHTIEVAVIARQDSGNVLSPYVRRVLMHPDGDSLYLLDETMGSRVRQKELSTAWDISSYTDTLLSEITVSNYEDVAFGTNGNRMFVLTSTTIEMYWLSAQWDVSTAYSHWMSPPITHSVSDPASINFSTDGTVLFIMDAYTEVTAYTLATPWDLGDLTLQGAFTLDSNSSWGRWKISFSDAGDKIYLCLGQALYQYDLSTAWDVSTAALMSGVALEESGSISVAFKPGGSQMYLAHVNPGGFSGIVQYNLPTPWYLNTAAPSIKLVESTLDTTSITFSETLPVDIDFSENPFSEGDVYVVPRAVNKYNVESQNQQPTILTISDTGEEELGPISDPDSIEMFTVADDKFLITARYLGYSTDKNPADTWRIYVKANVVPVPGVDRPVATAIVRNERMGIQTPVFPDGDKSYFAAVTVYRAEDDLESGAITFELALDADPLVPIAVKGGFSKPTTQPVPFSLSQRGLHGVLTTIEKAQQGSAYMAISVATESMDFDSWVGAPQSAFVDTVDSTGWSATHTRVYEGLSSFQAESGSYCAYMEKDPDDAEIKSPLFVNGISTVSFKYRIDGAGLVSFATQISPDGATWTTLDSVGAGAASIFNWVSYSKTISNHSSLYFRILMTGTPTPFRNLIIDSIDLDYYEF